MRLRAPALLLLALLAAGPSRSVEGERPSGDEVARRIDARDEGVSMSRTILMRLIDKGGGERERETRSFRKYYGADKKTAIFYLSPQSLRGTAFLTFDYAEPGREDDQWLYLPALRKSRRISASDRGDYFLGTDLSYDDVKRETKVTLEDYHWKTTGEDTLDGHPCFVLEAIPASEDVAHELRVSKVVSWVDSEIWMVRRAQYYDLRGELWKTIDVGDIRQVQGIWTPHQIEVANENGHRSVLVISNVDYQSEIADDLFTERALARGLP